MPNEAAILDVEVENERKGKLRSYEIRQRRARHYALFRAGKKVNEIAKSTGCDPDMIDNDISHWEQAGGDTAPLVLGRAGTFLKAWSEYELIKYVSFTAWEKSQKPQRTKRTKTTTKGDETTIEELRESRDSAGDPRFLAQFESALRQQNILAGFVSDGQGGRSTVAAADVEGDDDSVAIVEVGSRAEAAALDGVRFVRLGGAGIIDGQVLEVVERAQAGGTVQPAGDDGGAVVEPG